MTTNAYLLVEAAVGRAKDVAINLRGLKGVESVDVVTGPYDVIAQLRGDVPAIGQMVTEQVHKINGVVRTVTCIGTNGRSAPA